MKNQLFFKLAIACCVAFSTAKAQTVDSVKLSDLKEAYLEVREYRQFLSDKIFIAVDFGQKRDENNFQEDVVRGANGKYLAYNSVIDFVNMMKPLGYELFQVYTKIYSGDSSSRYILKRKSDLVLAK